MFGAIKKLLNLVPRVRQNSTKTMMEYVEISKGVKMPMIGYGTWNATDAELEAAVEAALEAGYRHIDTAYVYENEKVIGTVVKRWIDSGKLTRDDLFLVTKVPPGGNRPEGVSKYIKKSLEFLQVDYVDLYLVHVPFGFKDVEDNLHPFKEDGTIDMDVNTDHIAIWKAMEEQVDKGLAKSIGISNFNRAQVSRILKNARIRPSSLQIELHAYHQQNELVDFCKKNDIVVTAYSPLGNPGLATFLTQFGQHVKLPNIMENPIVNELAKKHNKTPAQILLRHIVQRGICAIPKSTNPKRLRQNIDIFDFSLDQEDMEAMNGLDQGVRLLDFSVFKGIQAHPEYPFPEMKK
ncbi:1,5-anhydro-D-fructose reductase-like isoform X2 [Anthonomus grandis grandis]|uniref:1,5-anhydro-D-fructose reductase-like isoform X2 n=1 Tax=Anthonomus grandis grandis TaxID=2921223 RepID=UPI0021665750|nr:1,5-anhydro-D-fructose reductase-like isoform X2 [Anthonomus grandis grandis]